ncbi:hypothetical protein K4K53_011606 [Colletotrichum sp. SAR 10_77]|nr:hypothetical protein K4K53_011606 [Colletotrichum sp. SAR 10_77]
MTPESSFAAGAVSMEQFDGKKLKDDDLAAFRARQFVRFHKHLQSLTQNQGVKDILALTEPLVDKMTSWAESTKEYKNETPFPGSWRVHEPRHFKGQLTSYFRKFGQPPAQTEDDAEATPDAKQITAQGNQDDPSLDDVATAIESIAIDGDEKDVSARMPGAFDSTEAGERPPTLGQAHLRPHGQEAGPLAPGKKTPAPEPKPIVVPPPPPPPPLLPDEYYAFARARSSRGHAEQQLERVMTESKKATGVLCGATEELDARRELGEAERRVKITKAAFKAWAREGQQKHSQED